MQNAESGVRGAASPAPRHAPRTTPHSGVALVITLVLISVITFMAITFLVVSRSQHGAVATTTDQAVARVAADYARERSVVQLLAPMMAWTNEFSYGLTVSTNYINAAGFDHTLPLPGPATLTNVNYDYNRVGGALNAAQLQRNIANLLYDPRPPVYITNRVGYSNEFRFYLDLNRNGRYDPNGLQPLVVKNALGQLGFYDLNGGWVGYQWPPPPNIVSNFFVGDPEWIGVLQRPEYAHSATNLFIARYAYLVVPVGQTLDINTIHNDAKQLDLGVGAARDGFLRNQGVGTWEINLAAFLTDLNTNFWLTYGYAPWSGSVNPDLNSNSGLAFEDASSLLWYRYYYPFNRNCLASVSTFFPVNGAYTFQYDFVDGYSGGPIMTNTWWPVTTDADDNTRTSSPWSGSDNPNRFYSTQDLFDRQKIPIRPTGGAYSFVDRLQMAGTNIDSYNRYTFSRLLSQLGTDSAPEPSGKMNLNYRNVDDNGYVVPNMVTNFIAWEPARFFTNAAIRLLADAGYAVGDYRYATNVLVTNVVNGVLFTNLNIPIWPTNYYTPSVHRLFQLAANLFDATTNRTDLDNAYPQLPTVFRPLFTPPVNGRIFIAGYREVTAADTDNLVKRWDAVRDLSEPADLAAFDPARDMVYGIPLVLGAKKGFPNFNEYGVHTHMQVTRKLQFHRPGVSTNLPVNETNQMFIVGISNVLGVEAWNSYSTPCPRSLTMYVWPDISVRLSSHENNGSNWLNPPPFLSRYRLLTAVMTNLPANTWFGYDPSQEWTSFQIPLSTSRVFLTNACYWRPTDSFVVPVNNRFERSPGTANFHVPKWQGKFTPRLRFALVDDVANRIVDYVNLADDNPPRDITTDLFADVANPTFYTPDGKIGSMWLTNRDTPPDSVPTYGIRNQLEASLGHIKADWNSSTHEFPPGMDKDKAIAYFKGQFLPSGTYPNTANTFNAPYQPFRDLNYTTSWQANDPLVHYTTGDLTDLVRTNLVLDKFTSSSPNPVANLGSVNRRYEPWGRSRSATAGATREQYAIEKKDPVTTLDRPEGRSDDWDFPTNKFPNAGWVGRVHRGTPWQTAYLKSSGCDAEAWRQWTGNGVWMTNFGQLAATTNMFPLYNAYQDSYLSQPTNDWRLLDLFTTALNDNATRGQLSINQTNLAAWSAVLSGVVVHTNYDNAGNPGLYPLVIQPAGVYDAYGTSQPPVVRLVSAINRVRANTNTAGFVFPNQVFRRLGDILTVPELTVASPFLNTNAPPGAPDYVLNDAAIERLPQQIAGLLKVDSVPRFAIYAFGQTLKPALRSPFVTSGQFSGLCTNYQIMAETATRTVVRFEGVPLYQRGTPSAITNLHPVIESFNVLSGD